MCPSATTGNTRRRRAVGPRPAPCSTVRSDAATHRAVARWGHRNRGGLLDLTAGDDMEVPTGRTVTSA